MGKICETSMCVGSERARELWMMTAYTIRCLLSVMEHCRIDVVKCERTENLSSR